MMENQVCDICHQNPASHHLIDAEVAGGSVERHICDACFQRYPDPYASDIAQLLKNGKCQFCGAPAMIVDGVPPRRKIMCYACADREYG
jgi:hypothetical protein